MALSREVCKTFGFFALGRVPNYYIKSRAVGPPGCSPGIRRKWYVTHGPEYLGQSRLIISHFGHTLGPNVAL